MAALLRSARFIKCKPPCLLQITGTKNTGVALGRLYSGATGSRNLGVCSRQLFPALDNAARCVLPYTSGFVRNYTVTTERKDESSGAAVRLKQAQLLEYALSKLDRSVRRTGRITKTLLLSIFNDICRTGYPSGNQALLLFRSCGSLLPEVPPASRTELAHHIWEKLENLGVQYDVSHYNALLKVYLQSEFKFSPMDFLAKMEAANILPNRVTYQRLIAAYCENGDIDGASAILGFMKTKDLPITEAVFNSLITGHARSGDIESAENILTVMRNAGVEPSSDTYVSLLKAYAQNGDMENVNATLEAAESADCTLMDRDIMQVIFTLAKAGYHQHTPELAERMRHDRNYIPDAMNLCCSLITHGHEDTAFLILKSMSTEQMANVSQEPVNHGSFFLRHCVTMETSPEKIWQYCKELQEANLYTSPFTFALYCALQAKKTSMSIEMMKILKDQKMPVRPHFFWPLLIAHVKEKNIAGVTEIVKAMDDLGMALNEDTLFTYVIPAFPSIEEARQSLKDVGVTLDLSLLRDVRTLALQNLASLYTLLSNASLSASDLIYCRGPLILGFRRSSDVESMVKITELLFKNKDFDEDNSKAAEAAGYFLYNLIARMSASEVQAQEDKLRKYFNQLQEQNITISANLFRGIQKLLEAYNVPELVKVVLILVDPKEKDRRVVSQGVTSITEGEDMLSLEKKLKELKSENKSFSATLKHILKILAAEENLQRALELKQQYEEGMTAAAYAVLINLCCLHDNAEEALNLKREMSLKDPSVALDVGKYIALVKTLSKNGKVEDAVDILKEMKEKNVVLDDAQTRTQIFHMLNTLGPKGGADTIRRLQNTIFTLGLAKPSGLCSPLISAYLESDDLPGALGAVIECQKLYKQVPRIHDVIVALVQQGDTERLREAMDFLSQETGEMAMLYNLFFAFLETGRYREARKIMETPGLRARPGRLQWYAEKCISSTKMESLEQMVELTSKLFDCDRDEMYFYVLQLCQNTNDWQKAEVMWTKMQEENVIPRERTLHLLADILKDNGQEVPFEVHETWYDHAKLPIPAPASATNDNHRDPSLQLQILCKQGKTKEASSLLKDFEKKGVEVKSFSYDQLIRKLLAEGALEDAMDVKDIAISHITSFTLSDHARNLLIVTQCKRGLVEDALVTLKSMLQDALVPSVLAINRIVQTLGGQGKITTIQEVESLMMGLNTPLNLSRMLFTNNTALALINNGDLDSAVEIMESTYTNPISPPLSMSYVFRKVLEDGNDKAFDKLNAEAERLANHFASYRAAGDIFLQLVDLGKVDDAKFMLARCNAVAEQKDMLMSYLARKSEKPGQLNKIKELMNLIPDFAEKDVQYSYLMKCHVLDNDLTSAKALLEQMQKEGIETNELLLKRLALLYRKAGETLPFPEPPESFKFYADKLREKESKTRIIIE